MHGEGGEQPTKQKALPMFTAIAVTLILLAALASALRTDRRRGELITHRPYNNRHSDASAARDWALFE
jgi:hypothetical protein